MLSPTKNTHSNIEREMLAVVFALTRFHHYVFNRKVTIHSDHKPLESICKKALGQAPPRLQRMLLKIQQYDFSVIYVPGKELHIADCLSRLTNVNQNTTEIPGLDITIHEIVAASNSRVAKVSAATRDDLVLQELKCSVQDGFPKERHQCAMTIQDFWNYRDELSIYDDIIVKGDRIIIPESMRNEILEQLHAGHQGIEKTRLRAKSTVFWPGINADIEKHVKQCDECQKHQASATRDYNNEIETTYPFEILGSDIFMWDNKNFLILVDYFTSYFFVRPLNDITSNTVIKQIKTVMSEFGVPTRLHTDSGTQYTSQMFADFANDYGFIHTTSSPHYHESNGKSERFIGTIKKTLQKCLESKQDPHMALLILRTTPISSNMPSPADMLFTYKLKNNLPIISHEEERGRDNIHKFTVNQPVYIQNPLTKKWSHGTISGFPPEPNSYFVSTPDGGKYRRNQVHIRARMLKPEAPPGSNDNNNMTTDTPPTITPCEDESRRSRRPHVTTNKYQAGFT